jgi:hypothetical protein
MNVVLPYYEKDLVDSACEKVIAESTNAWRKVLNTSLLLIAKFIQRRHYMHYFIFCKMNIDFLNIKINQFKIFLNNYEIFIYIKFTCLMHLFSPLDLGYHLISFLPVQHSILLDITNQNQF